jgi:hypothetical protein
MDFETKKKKGLEIINDYYHKKTIGWKEKTLRLKKLLEEK